jgi:hypothetical protein
MREAIKTAGFAGAAVVLGIAAAVVQPEAAIPKIFSDQGTAFYPKFTDPQTAKTIEIVDYDESTATATPLKVQFNKGRWVIASHNDYPVEIGDRLAKTAAALMDLKKDIVRSDSIQEHANLGVIDPLDPKAGLAGRGKRVTLRDAHGEMLADFIFGKAAEGKAGYRYMRVPGEKRTYSVKTDADPSAKFADWVNAGILRIAGSSIRKINVNRYNIDAAMGRLSQVDRIALTPESKPWKPVVAALDGLKIVDVKPKPPSLAQGLKEGKLELSLETAVSLRQKGYFLSPEGRMFASEGDMSVETANGVVYTLRFGDLAGTSGDNRNLFVTTGFDEARAKSYGGDAATGERQAKDLNARFANWYYIISGKDFQRLTQRQPGRERPAEVKPAGEPPAPPPAGE